MAVASDGPSEARRKKRDPRAAMRSSEAEATQHNARSPTSFSPLPRSVAASLTAITPHARPRSAAPALRASCSRARHFKVRIATFVPLSRSRCSVSRSPGHTLFVSSRASSARLFVVLGESRMHVENAVRFRDQISSVLAI